MWGSPGKTVDLVIDDRTLLITSAQKYMVSDLSDVNTVRYLWIDTICINQEDVPEKNSQVRLMGEIYSRANYVLAYLNGSHHSSYQSAYRSGESRSRLSLYSVLASIRAAVTEGDEVASTTRLHYARFFDNVYFVRRWIIQEICLARSVIIRCDGYELSMQLLDRYLAQLRPDNEFTHSRAANICDLRRNMWTAMPKLEKLLYDHENAVCSEPFDRVYALLALSKSGKRHILVDYSMGPLKLLLSVVRMASVHEQLRESRTLSFACFLRQHLGITSMDFELEPYATGPQGDEIEEHRFLARVQVLSITGSTRIDADAEDGLNRLRPHLPSLRNYGSIELKRLEPVGLIMPNQVREERHEFGCGSRFDREKPDPGIKVDALNLWAFSSMLLTARDRPGDHRETLLAGVSSGVLNHNDEVWQFPRTPVALIARQTTRGYVLVARALVLKSSAWRLTGGYATARSGLRELENMLEWITDAGDGIDTKTISMAPGDLLRLMKWVDMFADE